MSDVNKELGKSNLGPKIVVIFRFIFTIDFPPLLMTFFIHEHQQE
jgi:hypothetical protein